MTNLFSKKTIQLMTVTALTMQVMSFNAFAQTQVSETVKARNEVVAQQLKLENLNI